MDTFRAFRSHVPNLMMGEYLSRKLIAPVQVHVHFSACGVVPTSGAPLPSLLVCSWTPGRTWFTESDALRVVKLQNFDVYSVSEARTMCDVANSSW